MKNNFLVISVILLLVGCSSGDDNSNRSLNQNATYPECLQAQIDVILGAPQRDPRGKIEKYNYHQQAVYVVKNNFDDFPTVVYDQKCEVICSIGGYNGQDSCEDFENAQRIETVWIDER